MKILTSFDELKTLEKNMVFALGTFDGLHVGHQDVIEKAVTEAYELDAYAIVVTFDKHPFHIINPEREPKALRQQSEKITLLEGMAVDYVLMLPMTKELINMSPQAFVEALTASKKAVGFVMGENFSFGAGGKGNPQVFEDYLKTTDCRNAKVYTMRLTKCSKRPDHVSSTLIRNLIGAGDFPAANALLGQPFRFAGQVITGDRRGRTLGFPTLNFLYPQDLVLPPDGVYVNRVYIDGAWYKGVGNLGDNPTFENQYHRFEVHLFDFDRDVYGYEAIVEFYALLRGEERFNSLDELIDQMKTDEQRAKDFFKEHNM